MKTFQINISNKLFYTLILIGITSLLAIGVLAFGSGDSLIHGHDAGEISGLTDTNAGTICSSGQYLDGDGTCKVATITDTNAGTICSSGQYLDGDGTCKAMSTNIICPCGTCWKTQCLGGVHRFCTPAGWKIFDSTNICPTGG